MTQRFRVYKRVSNTCSVCGQVQARVGVYVWFCSFFCILSPPGCSCDDVGSAAARSLVDPRYLEGDGDKRTQHNLEKIAVSVGGDHHSAVKHL